MLLSQIAAYMCKEKYFNKCALAIKNKTKLSLACDPQLQLQYVVETMLLDCTCVVYQAKTAVW